jgi:phage terminase large subunit
MAAVWGYAEKLRILCTRELQVSIKESFHAELKNAIQSQPWLEAAYDVGVDYIRGKNGTEFVFRGLRHNMSGIKSMAQIDLCIVEEAEDVPEHSWTDLEPTIRAPKSEIWAVWNPKNEGSPVDQRFIQNPPDNAIVVELNYSDNPWFPSVLDSARLRDKQIMDAAKYAHIWEGAYLRNSDSQVFNGRYTIKEFTPAHDWRGPFCGLDFGFASDPTAAVQCWIHADTLYIEHEAGGTGMELDDTANAVGSKIPSFNRRTIFADSARPESISYLRRHGMPNVRSVKKWPGSVEDGVEHIKTYQQVVIHPRCRETAREFMLYSYKVDKYTGEVLTAIVDAHNHYIDALRYALSERIRHKPVLFEVL